MISKKSCYFYKIRKLLWSDLTQIILLSHTSALIVFWLRSSSWIYHYDTAIQYFRWFVFLCWLLLLFLVVPLYERVTVERSYRKVLFDLFLIIPILVPKVTNDLFNVLSYNLQFLILPVYVLVNHKSSRNINDFKIAVRADIIIILIKTISLLYKYSIISSYQDTQLNLLNKPSDFRIDFLFFLVWMLVAIICVVRKFKPVLYKLLKKISLPFLLTLPLFALLFSVSNVQLSYVTGKYYYLLFVLVLMLLCFAMKAKVKLYSVIDYSIFNIFISLFAFSISTYGFYFKLFYNDNNVILICSIYTVLSFPFIAESIRINYISGKQIKITLTILLAVYILLFVLISGSRTSFLAIIACIIYYIFVCKTYKSHCPLNRKVINNILIVLCIISFLFVLLYNSNALSIHGRLNIWHITINMIRDKPFLGYGINGFAEHYMDYQANYNLYDSDNHMLAGNIIHPYNELLHFAVRFGIFGCVLLLLSIFVLFKTIYTKQNRHRFLFTGSIISVSVLSMFSSPFLLYGTYFFVSLYVFWGLSSLTKQSLKIKYGTRLLIYPVLIILCMFVLSTIRTYNRWYKTSETDIQESLSEYSLLSLGRLNNDPYFLLDYAETLFYHERYSKCYETLIKCSKYLSNYDVEMLFGESLLNMNDFESSIVHFKNAYYMIPSKFTPIYKLFLIYKSLDNLEEAVHYAAIIVNKPVKVNSLAIKYYKSECENFIEKHRMLYESRKDDQKQ